MATTVITGRDVTFTIGGNTSDAQATSATLTGETVLRTNTPLNFEGEQANAKAVFIDGGAVPGNFSSVTFSFANAGRVTIQAKIVANTDIYEGVIAKASL